MTILTSEIQWRRAALLSDSIPASNGGRMTATPIVSGVKNNLFPDVSQAERSAGIAHWRKAFVAVRSPGADVLLNPKLSIEAPSAGDSYLLLYAGTHDDTQDEVIGRPYGIGVLAAAVGLGDTVLSVAAESAEYSAMSDKPFQSGDLVRIDARADVLSAGASEYRTIATVTYAGAAMAITLAEGLTGAYDAGAVVASVLQPDDVACVYADVATTGGLTCTPAGALALTNLGAIFQTWTVTVTNAATGALAVSGDLVGAVGTGALGATLAPLNPASGTPYFSLAPGAWGGTPGTGDTLTFSTIPAAVPLWSRRVVPAGAAAIAVDTLAVCLEGETA
ncbi:hypothetical protein [uncultured Thiodictyon sp.]|uniref:hypothetical protein n=1 Tax=uncultured Thiodictyon sp. TaxID=1846217 RepID=UPI0025E8C93C|nr:hypothetical protein [uncultured Thiodictyon sp.]